VEELAELPVTGDSALANAEYVDGGRPRARGPPQAAVPVLERALEAFERKGNLVSAEKTRARLERLTPA
jgi:hypothetical protein